MPSSTSKCRGCLNQASSFCYMCGKFTTVAQRRTITSPLRTAYFHYFDCKIGDQDKSWALHICCKPCYNGLTAGFNSKKAAFNFAVPMVWREPQNHADDCYFNASSRKKIKYPNLRSTMRPVPNSDNLPVPTPPVNKDLLSSSDEEMPSLEDSAESISLEDIFESTYSGTSGNEPHWITQEDLNDLARDLYLSKQQSGLLASRLKQWNLVQEECKYHQFQESEQIRSLVFLWVCKRASQSTVVFSVSGIVELYPSITSRKTGFLEALFFLANTASRRILRWT